MPAHTERELKLMLDAESYQRLLRWAAESGQEAAPRTQINLYFDTPDLDLARARMMIRLRHKGGRYTLCFKRQRALDAGAMDALEVESDLDNGLGVQVLAASSFPDLPPCPPLDALRAEAEALGVCVAPLIRQGTLTTHRVALASPQGLPLELDHSEYAGVEDWELECETDDLDLARATLLPWLDALQIRYTPSERTKVARLFAALEPEPDPPSQEA